MPTYLESLTLRLAHGLAEVPEDVRARHAGFIKKSQSPDGGFPGREGGGDLYYTSFALRGLALSGELDGAVAERAAEFLRSRLSGETPMIDFLSLLYGAELLRLAAGVDILADSPSGWQVKVAEELENFRRDDGGYAKTDAGHSSSTYHTFLVVLAHQLLGRDTPDPQRIVEFVRSRARVDGGFVEIGAMKRSGTNPTAAAAGLLRIFDALDETTGDETAEFVAGMQTDEGGLRANTRIPIADTLSTFTGLLTLADLGRLEWIDRQTAIDYIHEVELPGGGFRGAVWDLATDVEYTFYGLGSLALLSA